MAATRNALNDFVLTPQQQNLLFAALNSNKPASASPANNALNLSPTSYNDSPVQRSDASGFQESPYLDYDYEFNGDSSFDFDFANGGQPKMIGDLPGTDDTSKAESDDNDGNDKRSHPDDDDDDEEESAKRRESGEKTAKKPGRKPLTTEPSSKRKAQNRAAQRAFRERKEKHLKDLETKVTELEKASEATNHENGLLRAQVDKMTVELQEYKKRVALLAGSTRAPPQPQRTAFGQAVINNLNDVNFQFEFPKFGALPGPPQPSTTSLQSARSSLSQSPNLNRSPSSQVSPNDQGKGSVSSASSHYTSGLDAQTKEDLAKFSGIFSPPLTNNNVSNASRSSLDSHYSAAATNTSSPSASSNSNGGPSSSCGTSPEPFTQSPMGFKPVDTMATIGEEQPSLANNSQDFGHFASIDINDINFLASQNNFQFDPQLFGDYREPQDNVLGSGGIDDSFFNDAFDMDFTTPYNVAFNSPATTKKDLPAPGASKDLIAQIDAAKEGDDEIVGADGQLLTCNKIWEKLQNCPKVQNGDFDLDGLCSDLQKKAKCSGSGAVVNEKDFKNVMQKYLGKTDKEMEQCTGPKLTA